MGIKVRNYENHGGEGMMRASFIGRDAYCFFGEEAAYPSIDSCSVEFVKPRTDRVFRRHGELDTI